MFQPHLPVRLPCYDLAPVTSFTLGRSSRLRTSGTPGSHGLTGGVYKARERIHRAVAVDGPYHVVGAAACAASLYDKIQPDNAEKSAERQTDHRAGQ